MSCDNCLDSESTLRETLDRSNVDELKKLVALLPEVTLKFVLEWTEDLAFPVAWQAFSGNIECGFLVCKASIPIGELGCRRFFRLRYQE